MTLDPLEMAVAIADRLCDEALVYAGRATWLGDEKENVAGEWEVVHRSVQGDLYGGTAGIALFLTRLFAVTGDARHRTTALAGLAHAVEWQRRTRPTGSLYAGSAGVAAVLAEAGAILGEESLRASASAMTDEAIDRPTAERDLIGGRAGSIVALLHLWRTLGYRRALDAAQTQGRQLVDEALGEPYPGACWASDIGGEEAPLCGLAHGASGISFALGELSLATGDSRSAQCATEAALYERAWFQREQGNWPDLRELTRSKLLRGTLPKYPLFWCHGAIGIGLARLRQFELSGETIFAVEAETALQSAQRQLAELSDLEGPIDLCLCHGLAGVVELLLEGARVFGQPRLRELAMSCGRLGLGQVRDAEGPWPCGVPDGGENPSLMLGLAGIGMMFLRLADPGVAPAGMLYTQGVMKPTIIVQLGDTELSADLRQRAEELVRLVPGSRVERISKRGRVLLRVPAAASIEEAVETLSASPGVQYAEPDVVDHAVASESSRKGEK
jgi:lantibiotic modifying enzyme